MLHVWILLLVFVLAAGASSVPFLNSRIVGGENTVIEEYPYQVSIMLIDSHNCGGSIISSRFILTAAHCTADYSANVLMVRVGSSIIDEGGQVFQVQTIYQHPQYDSDTYDNDISILELSKPLSFDEAIKSINLPEQDAPVNANVIGTATGWGRLEDNGPVPMQLQKVDIPTLGDDVCSVIYNSQITETMFCAGTGGKDTCQGDSGGPFAADGFLIGITSWGDECGNAQSPGVYTKVSRFRSYIDSIIN